MDLLTTHGTLDALHLIRNYIIEAGIKVGLDSRSVYQLRLAVDEIATNAVVHGFINSTCQKPLLKIQASIDKEHLRIILKDNGAIYDPRTAPYPTSLELPLEERSEGGLGIYLALQSVDSFSYERVETWNHHTFIMNRDRQHRAYADFGFDSTNASSLKIG